MFNKGIKITKKLLDATYNSGKRNMTFRLKTKEGYYLVECNIKKYNKIFGESNNKEFEIPISGWVD